MDKWVTPPKGVTSPSLSPPPPWKQALGIRFLPVLEKLLIGAFLDLESLGTTSDVESVPSLVAQITVFQEFLP